MCRNVLRDQMHKAMTPKHPYHFYRRAKKWVIDVLSINQRLYLITSMPFQSGSCWREADGWGSPVTWHGVSLPETTNGKHFVVKIQFVVELYLLKIPLKYNHKFRKCFKTKSVQTQLSSIYYRELNVSTYFRNISDLSFKSKDCEHEDDLKYVETLLIICCERELDALKNVNSRRHAWGWHKECRNICRDKHTPK